MVLHEGKSLWMLGVLDRLCMRNLVGRKVGMNDMWDAMCHEERKKMCSTPR